MAYYNKGNQEPLPKDDISTWECTQEDCNGWMRKNFTSSSQPTCPLCGNEMISGIRHITVLANGLLNKEKK